MTKFAILALLVVFVAVCAARRNKATERQNRRQQPDLSNILEDSNVPEAATRKLRRNKQADASTIIEETRVDAKYPSTKLSRRGKGTNGGERLLGRVEEQQAPENQIADAAEGGVIAQSSLQAFDRDLDSVRALLQRKEARQEKLDAKAERRARNRDAEKAAASDSLKAASDLAFETYDHAEDFNNLDANAVRNEENSLGFQFVSDNRLQQAADISQTSGARAATGTSLKFQDLLDAESQFDAAALSESEEIVDDALNAELDTENGLRAEAEAVRANEAAIDAQSAFEAGGSFRSSDDFFGGRFGAGGGIFGR